MKASRVVVLSIGVAVAGSACGLLSGCGSGSDEKFAAKINPEMLAKEKEMFKGYGAQEAARGRAARTKKH